MHNETAIAVMSVPDMRFSGERQCKKAECIIVSCQHNGISPKQFRGYKRNMCNLAIEKSLAVFDTEELRQIHHLLVPASIACSQYADLHGLLQGFSQEKVSSMFLPAS